MNPCLRKKTCSTLAQSLRPEHCAELRQLTASVTGMLPVSRQRFAISSRFPVGAGFALRRGPQGRLLNGRMPTNSFSAQNEIAHKADAVELPSCSRRVFLRPDKSRDSKSARIRRASPPKRGPSLRMCSREQLARRRRERAPLPFPSRLRFRIELDSTAIESLKELALAH